MPRKIILVRHGQTDFNVNHIMQGHTDSLLNKTGFEQAKTASEIVKKIRIDVLYASNLKRAFQTALIISKEISLSVTPEPLLRERTFGDLEGYTSKEATKIHSNFSWERGFIDQGSKFLGIESNIQMKKRITKLLKKLASKHKNKNVLLVTHGGIIWNFIEYFNLAEQISDFDKFFANAGVTILKKTKEGYKIKDLTP